MPLARPCDTLELTFGPAPGKFSLYADDPALAGDSNTIARAWRAFAERTGYAPELTVRLTKGIPMGAGLGGGSADAAAVLGALNDRAGQRALAPQELAQLAAGIGADVPFFLLNGPAWAEGIGDALTPVALDLTGLTLLLLCPDVHVSTQWAYRTWDEYHIERADRLQNRRDFLTCAKEKFKSSPCSRILLLNSFEDVVFPAHPKLRRYKEKLISSGACAAVMSGSGASLLGLFRDSAQAEQCTRELQGQALSAYLHRY